MIRSTFRSLLIVLAAAGAVAGGAAWYAWAKGDEYARQQLQQRLSKIAPSCAIEIGKVRFDWNRSLTVHDLTIRPANAADRDEVPALSIPEAVLQIDRDRFLNEQVVDVKLIRLLGPELTITRRSDGTWSIDELRPFRLDPSMPLPEWHIEHGTLHVRLEQTDTEPISFMLRDAGARFVPTGERGFAVTALGNLSETGPLQIAGKIDLINETWSLSGAAKSLETTGPVANFLVKASAELQAGMAKLDSRLRELEQRLDADELPDRRVATNVAPHRTGNGPQSDSNTGGVVSNGIPQPAAASISPAEIAGLSELGLEATLDVQFSVGKVDPQQPLTWQVWVDFKEGQVTNPLLPLPLEHLKGRLYCDPARLTATALTASNGQTKLTLDADLPLGDAAAKSAGSLSLAATDLALSDAMHDNLTAGCQRLLDIVRPRGLVDVTAAFARDVTGLWKVTDFQLTAKNLSVRPEPFPYLIRDIKGTLRQTEPGRLFAQMQGMAGMRPVTLTAHVVDPGSDADVDVRITAEGVPLDAALRNACTPGVQETLQRVGIEGTAESLEVTIARPGGPDHHYHWWFKANVTQGQIEYEGFPYRLTNVTGDVAYDSEQRTLAFWNVVGRHDKSVITGAGSYRLLPDVNDDGTTPIGGPRPGLDLQLAGQGIALDSDLRGALPAGLKQHWDELRPGGMADLEARIECLPGGEPDIELTKLDVTQGTLYARAFPFVLDTIAARARFVPSRIEIVAGQPERTPAVLAIDEFVGWHAGGTRVTAPESQVTIEPGGQWLLSLPNLVVEDLEFGSDFRRAAPEGLRQAIEALDPGGRFTVSGRIDLRGARPLAGVTTAGWNLVIATQTPASAKAGLELKNVLGEVRCEGQQVRSETSLHGQISLRQADIFGQRLERIRGPFRLEQNRVVLGSAEALKVALEPDRPGAAPDVPVEQRLCADYLAGLLTLDAEVVLDRGPQYVGRVELTGGSLERYTHATQANLAGVMNGGISFWGQGASADAVKGRGQLDISPAALYELPVVMKMFNALFLAPPNGPAFSSAMLAFTIRDSGFVFDPREGGSIDLSGDTLRLIGGGRIGFDRILNLNFYSAMPRASVRTVKNVPIVGQAVGGLVQAASTGWVSVDVRGPADDPFVNTVPLKAIPDTFQRMFESLGPNRLPRTPLGPPFPR